MRRDFNRSMIFVLGPFLVSFFAVTMGVYHAKDKNDQPAHQQHDEHWFVAPDRFDEFGQIRFHAKRDYTTSVQIWEKIPAWRAGAAQCLAFCLTGI